MNKSVVFFLGIGAGGIIGGVVGFFLAKKKKATKNFTKTYKRRY